VSLRPSRLAPLDVCAVCEGGDDLPLVAGEGGDLLPLAASEGGVDIPLAAGEGGDLLPLAAGLGGGEFPPRVGPLLPLLLAAGEGGGDHLPPVEPLPLASSPLLAAGTARRRLGAVARTPMERPRDFSPAERPLARRASTRYRFSSEGSVPGAGDGAAPAGDAPRGQLAAAIRMAWLSRLEGIKLRFLRTPTQYIIYLRNRNSIPPPASI
jgi:hypothetical protein